MASKAQIRCFSTDCPLNDGDGGLLLFNGEDKLAERLIKDSEPRKSIGGWERFFKKPLSLRVVPRLNCCRHVCPGGEGESEEEEEDESATELKKPNTDEVKDICSRTGKGP